jgi:hypothetical protein
MGDYVVVAGGLVARMESETGEGYLYKGDRVPDGVPADEIERLAGLGLIATEEDAAKAEAERQPRAERNIPAKKPPADK